MRRLVDGMIGLFCVAICIDVGACCLSGCNQADTNIKEFSKEIKNEVVVPLVQEAVKNGVQGLGVQAGAQMIEPGYECEFEGYWVTGIKGKAVIRAVGISGQAQLHADTAEPATSQPSDAKAGDV